MVGLGDEFDDRQPSREDTFLSSDYPQCRLDVGCLDAWVRGSEGMEYEEVDRKLG